MEDWGEVESVCGLTIFGEERIFADVRHHFGDDFQRLLDHRSHVVAPQDAVAVVASPLQGLHVYRGFGHWVGTGCASRTMTWRKKSEFA